ncbi:flagellar hook-basal body complex protein FliE [Paenibacillus aurantius]|uniref:Flagellar hook-basal body complex protein FliE n=1 Tax=Paenibacillus aurantius TaxID=2918900 RepID=A0AA96LI45_9BACL|nr:flagellar hook-basal body complex protein FliE [Paenibacillus aurantius]WJH33263.1 flagellar hook-basal body complex protein FliE [Paenibacillus sp. CC-CFT747]WNQ13729.1 flagellar hook-basal body complex protein FliE [Paenibacillus aurantius]
MIEQVGLKAANLAALAPKPVAQGSAAELTKQFGSYLNEALTKLSVQEQQADQLNEKFIKGEVTDVHQVMIAAEKVSLGLEFTVQARNKVIEAYQEMMRMQM